MNKKLFNAILATFVSAVAVYNISLINNDNKMSELALANVEALAADDTGGSSQSTDACYYTYHVCETQLNSFWIELNRICPTFSGSVIKEDC